MVEKRQVLLVDVAVPGDSKLEQKEYEKITKYQDLKMEAETVGEESHGGTSSDRSPGYDSQRSTSNCKKTGDTHCMFTVIFDIPVVNIHISLPPL